MHRNQQISKRNQRVAQENSLDGNTSYGTQKGYSPDLKTPVVGYSEAKSFFKDLLERGFEDIDILVAMNEKFDRQLVEIVLQDCRRQGLI
jgi:hypothetical protein